MLFTYTCNRKLFLQISRYTIHKKEKRLPLVIMQESYTQLKLFYSNKNAVTDVWKQSVIAAKYSVPQVVTFPAQRAGLRWHSGTLAWLGGCPGLYTAEQPTKTLELQHYWASGCTQNPSDSFGPSFHARFCLQCTDTVAVWTQAGTPVPKRPQLFLLCLIQYKMGKKNQTKAVFITEQIYFTVMMKTIWFLLVSVFVQKIKHNRKDLCINSVSIYRNTLLSP